MDRIRNADKERLLAAPIDVGKHKAAALVCDFWGEIVVGPFEFALNEPGFEQLRSTIARAEASRDAAAVRVGLELGPQPLHWGRPEEFSSSSLISSAPGLQGDR